MRVALVCICRDEARFLPEWLSYHLALGMTEVFAFDNDSQDGTGATLRRLAGAYPIHALDWPSRPGEPPQQAAYNWALAHLVPGFDWVAFLDCDEFLVLHRHAAIGEWLAGYDEEVGAIGVNWLTFGSSQRESCDYDRVTTTFRTGGPRSWSNNRHFKTIARVGRLEWMGVHAGTLRSGLLVHPNGTPIEMGKAPGISVAIEHSVAQLNHYQVKSREDFARKMRRGRASLPPGDPCRLRADPEGFRRALDRNEVCYEEILPLAAGAEPLLAGMMRRLGG